MTTVWTLLALVCATVVAATQDYVIYPIITLNLQSAAVLNDAIIAQTGDCKKVYASSFPGHPPTFWVAPLDPQAVEKLKQHPLTQFTPTATELRVISQSSGEPNLDKYRNYVYASDAGKAAFVYHLEMGINANHDEFRSRRGDWVFTNLARRAQVDTKDDAAFPRGHSTCTASKATGNLYGTSKYATLVVVKMLDLSFKAMIDGLETAYRHIVSHKRGDRSIITISWGTIKIYRRKIDLDIEASRMGHLLALLGEQGVVIVCAAGNHARGPFGARGHVDTLPAAFDRGSLFPYKAPVMAVGNCNLAGKRYHASQVSPLHDKKLYAPGVGARCADLYSQTSSQLYTETSICKSQSSIE
ncbi:MAG: hypothetical protein Q9221_004849 [Calogaya cf. arnoldii]